MKREIDIPGKKLLFFYRIIVVIMLLLVVLLAAGSLYALIRSRDSGPLFRIGAGNGAANRGGQAVSGGGAIKDGESAYSVFTGIGTLRIQNADKAQASPQAVVIVTISFPYKAEDRLFTEELASHIVEFRAIATSYFAGLGRDKLVKLDEDKVKAEILARYNALLHLGRIDTLYFSDLMIVD
jgi:flagellar basal body-associated protein FliL